MGPVDLSCSLSGDMAPTTASILTVLFIVICDGHSRAVQPDSASPAAAESPSGEYRFNYNISEAHSRDVKSHSESSDGAEITGTYRILQPDGCIRVVRYTAGTMGFQPTVTYEGDGCQPADSADNRLTGTGPEDPAEQDPSQKSMDETSISEDLKSLTMDILDALIPVHDPVETTAMPVDDVVTETQEDSITVDSSSADPVVLPSDNVITPMDVHPAQFRSPTPLRNTKALLRRNWSHLLKMRSRNPIPAMRLMFQKKQLPGVGAHQKNRNRNTIRPLASKRFRPASSVKPQIPPQS